MSHKDFDISKLKRVDITKVVPNSWNPKEENTPEFQKILQSIKQKGLRGAVVVRTHPTTKGYFEIIDGQQRYTAAKALNYKEIIVYDEGEVDEKEAKELTIWYQQQVPFSRITEAYLVTEMADEFGLEELELPYTEKEFTEFKELADFNFGQYNTGDDENGDTQNIDGTVTMSVKLSKEDYEMVKSVIENYCEANGVEKSAAFVQIIRSAE